MTIHKILVLGGGSAGFLTAITLKRKLPNVQVTVVRSPRIGIISVGEGSTFTMPNYLHGYLGINPTTFHHEVHPTYKLGIRFLWGPRPEFFYTFSSQLDARSKDLPKANGYYCDDEFEYGDLNSALMAHGNTFERQSDGGPLVPTNVAYHLENAAFVEFLDKAVLASNIDIIDGTVETVEQDDEGITALRLESGQTLSADLYLDCSGFRSELIGKAFGEPFVDYSGSLFCDRALIGGWQRTDEPLNPYTTSETMDCGWCWQIEHDHYINRGYVYSSSFISDDQAAAEFRAKNPKVGETRVVKFTSGRYRDTWVKNAVAIGNASGFVEPLEATALAIIIDHVAALVRTLVDSDMQIRPLQREYFNKYSACNWDCIRRFLALHYKFNTRVENDFWRACWNDLDLADAAPIVAYYQENGPSLLWARSVIGASDPFGWEGYLAMLVGQKVPYAAKHEPTDHERQAWIAMRQKLKSRAMAGMRQEEALAIIRSDKWGWRPDFYTNASTW